MSLELTIDRLGAQGDGVADTASGPAFVPFTLPGERVEATEAGRRFRLDAVLTSSPQRQTPPCPHFGTCGGCDLQHADDALYTAFKRDVVVDALARVGLDTEIAPLVTCPPASRRRVALSAVGAGKSVHLGFNAAHSDQIVPIEVCPIALPAIQRALPALQRLTALLADRRTPLKLTVTGSPMT